MVAWKDRLQEKESFGGKNFNIEATTLQRQAPNLKCCCTEVHMCVRYKLRHPQAFEEEATGDKPRNTSKCLP